MNELISCVLGIIVGMVILTGILSEKVSLGNKAVDYIEQCQQDLPRNQYCTIKAVAPEETQ